MMGGKSRISKLSPALMSTTKANQLSFTGVTIHQSPCAPHDLLQDTYHKTKGSIEAAAHAVGQQHMQKQQHEKTAAAVFTGSMQGQQQHAKSLIVILGFAEVGQMSVALDAAAMAVTKQAGRRAGRRAGGQAGRQQLVPASISMSQSLSEGSLSQLA